MKKWHGAKVYWGVSNSRPIPKSFIEDREDPNRDKPASCGECSYFSRPPAGDSGQCDFTMQNIEVCGDDPGCPMGVKKIQKRSWLV